MSSIASKLTELGYKPLLKEDHPPVDHVAYPDKIGQHMPGDYREFLEAFPLTGSFNRVVVFAGIEKSPWASGGLERLELLYAGCSNPLHDLLTINEKKGTRGIPSHMRERKLAGIGAPIDHDPRLGFHAPRLLD